MVKPRDEVIAEFNLQNNMTVDELQAWLDDPQSKKAGTGVGIESGHKIVEILKKNPNKDPEQYDDEDIEHMRKVFGYNKRHMAQEDHLKETKTKDELENTKSTISMKNWGHDPVKTLDEEQSGEAADGAEEEVSSAPAEAPADEAPEQESNVGTGSKRKLAEATASKEDEGGDAGEVREDPAAAEGGEEVERGGEGGKDDADGDVEERARKKSRTTEDEA